MNDDQGWRVTTTEGTVAAARLCLTGIPWLPATEGPSPTATRRAVEKDEAHEADEVRQEVQHEERKG